jgi:CRP/FNR family cyclic AMP-dependent transcriptional regulator
MAASSPPVLAVAEPNALDELPAPLRALALRGELRRYRKGTLLIQEGDLGDTLYIILSGRLRVFSADEQGREVTYEVYGKGEYLGEMSLDGGPRSASVVTQEASSCVVLTRQSLLAHIAEHPEFALDLLAKVIGRARAVTEKARQLALVDVYGRLKILLESQLPEEGCGLGRLIDRLTHQEMANRMGCSREMVSRLMKDLERGGFVEPGSEGMVLLRKLPSHW